MHYAIIGNGVAGITAALTLRRRDPSARITVISGESDYFFSRTALMYAFMDRLTLRDMEPHERGLYDNLRIERVRAWVRNLDASARSLTLAGGRALRYDQLLLATGSVPNRPSWPGLDQVRHGAVHFVSLQHLEECERLAATARRAVVVGGGLIGIELVECLRHHGIHVTFLVREDWYWPVALASEEGELVAAHARRHGVAIRIAEEVAEVLSDSEGRLRAVRTSRGDELPAEMLGVTTGVRPAIDWLASVATPPALGRGIQVTPAFRTSLDGVFAAGDCAEILRPGAPPLIEQIWYSAKLQGELAALSMLGDSVAYEPPIFYNSAKFFDIEYTTVGNLLRIPPAARTFFHRVPGRDTTIRIVENDGAVVGFNMLGSRWNHELFETWIRERRSLDQVLSLLHTAQFDVEFGRLKLEVR
jgi:NADPH-dependent 2,4-dienoyl-CoA reductase/sulfur reductase-like enzyme